MKSIVFLDRDGTINDDPGYLSDPKQFVFLPNSIAGLRILKEAGFLIAVVSNQSGIARGYFTEEQLALVHDKMCRGLAAQGITVDGIYYCPHYPEGKIEKYALACNCRKPSPGLLQMAAGEFQVDLQNCYMVGDKLSDIEAGFNAGCKTVLVLTGNGSKTISKRTGWVKEPDYIAEDLLAAANWILKKDTV